MMSPIRSSWLLLPGRDPAVIFRAQVENIAGGVRTLSIEGQIRVRDGGPRRMPRIGGMTGFDHRGHLIARRLGGPDAPANLVPMHGLLNMRGYPYYRMEDEVAALIGDRPGQMKLSVRYADPDSLRPHAFHVRAINHQGSRFERQLFNFNASLAPRRPPS